MPRPVGACDVPNASMEDSPGGFPTGWQPYVFPGQCAGEGVSRTTEDAHTGAASLRIVDTSTGCTGAVSSAVPITPGLPYRVGMWAKAVEGTPQVGVFLAYYTSADAPYLSYATKIPFAGSPGPEWTQIGGTTQQVVGATHVRLWAYAPMGAAGVTLVDDFVLRADIGS